MYENKAFDVGTKEQTADEFGRYCVAFIEKYEAWYRVEVIDWLPVCFFHCYLFFSQSYLD